jgi:AAA+ ATPase superfamily predicted ATPase
MVTMAAFQFSGRVMELALLQQEWEAEDARLLIIYGRRRVGKTRLITHWIKSAAPRALYWVAEPTSSADQLRSFSQALYGFEGTSPVHENFSFGSWKLAFEHVSRIAQNGRFTLVMDEFTYLISLEPGIAGILQNAWDHGLKQANVFIIISGSHIGMMERGVLSYQAPLYGRATAKMLLRPMPFKDTRVFFPKYRLDERVVVYAMFGGVPAYWEQLDPSASLDRNIKERVLGGSNQIQDEPRLLLQDFVSEIHNYAAILQAISRGFRTPRDIAAESGLNDRHISMYLSNLVNTGFLERRLPITEKAVSRAGRHYITDPFLRFYFRFLSSRQAQIALGVQDQVLAEMKRHLVDFIGTYTWEELCKEWLLRSTGYRVLPFMPDQVGSIWNKEAQIDVAGINTMEKTLILGECKWDRHPIDLGILTSLLEKTEKVIPKEGNWRVYYLGFARSGWTPQAKEFADGLPKAKVTGKNWRAVGMLLKNLEQIDQDLSAWTM